MDRGLHVEGKLFDDVGMVSPIIGDLKQSVRSDDFEGWLVCNGQAVSRTTYADLFALIGETFGSGNGTTTFNLPDTRGRVIGSAGSSTAGFHCTGELVGEETHTLSIPEMPEHNHGVTDPTHNHGITDPGHNHTYFGVNSQGVASGLDNAAENSPRPVETTSTSTTGITINNAATGISINYTGGSLPHNNMQPTIFLGNTFIYGGVKNPSTASNPPCSNTYVIESPCGL
jgi:microcystin-dependent protein